MPRNLKFPKEVLTLVADNYILELPKGVSERLMERLAARWSSMSSGPQDKSIDSDLRGEPEA